MRLSECYTTLNVSPDAKWEEVRKSYHFLAKKYHPDLHPGKPSMTPKFQKISVAFKTLETRYKTGPERKAAWKSIQENRQRFTKKQEADEPQVATPLGEKPTPLHKNHSTENRKSDDTGSGTNFFEMEKKIFSLDIRKNIFLKKRLPSHSNIVRIKMRNESFQVRIPPGPWTQMFIRVPEKGHKSMFSKKRGDLLLDIYVPNNESPEPAPATYYYKVRIPENTIGTDKIWTLKSATGPIKFTLPKTVQDGQKLLLKANRDSGDAAASHIMTLSLVNQVRSTPTRIDTFA